MTCYDIKAMFIDKNEILLLLYLVISKPNISSSTVSKNSPKLSQSSGKFTPFDGSIPSIATEENTDMAFEKIINEKKRRQDIIDKQKRQLEPCN